VRLGFLKDPDTGKRQARPNPESEWVTQEVPELHILDGDLWNAAKARQAAIKYTRSDDGETENHFRERRRPKRELHRRRHCCHPVEAVDTRRRCAPPSRLCLHV
jgi:hypothetical protein